MPEDQDQLPTKGVGDTDLLEEQSRHVLRSKLPMKDAMITPFDGKYPNIDVHIEFFGSKGSLGVRMFGSRHYG